MFLKIFTNPHSQTTPITPIGADHLQTFTNFIVKWQAGKVKDLQGGLKPSTSRSTRRSKQAEGRRRRP